MWPVALVQRGSVLLDPAIHRRRIDRQSALLHDLLQIPITQGIAQVPADADQDNLTFEVTPLERVGRTHEQGPGMR